MLNFIANYSEAIQAISSLGSVITATLSLIVVWYFASQTNKLQKDLKLIQLKDITHTKAIGIVEIITSEIEDIRIKHYKMAVDFVRQGRDENLLETHHLAQLDILIENLKECRNKLFTIVGSLETTEKQLKSYLTALQRVELLYKLNKGPSSHLNNFQKDGNAVLEERDVSSIMHGFHDALESIESIKHILNFN